MKRLFLLTTLVGLFAAVCHGQKKYEMVIEKTDGTNIVVNTEDIVRTYFRERTGGDNPQPAAIDIVGTWYVYEADVQGLDGIWIFNADGTGTIEEFYHGESEGVDKITYEFSGTRLSIFFVDDEDDTPVFDITIISKDEFTWTDGEDTLTFKRQATENNTNISIEGKWLQYADDKTEASAEWVFNSDGTGYCTPLPIIEGEGPDPFKYQFEGNTLTIYWEGEENHPRVIEITVVSENEFYFNNWSEWSRILTLKRDSSQPSEPQGYLSCPDNNHPHMIDLGLPSGTKWACCNVDADMPESYGGYYAFGEIEEKSVYNEKTYMFNLISDYMLLGNDFAGTQYDVAHVKWGGSWVMPSCGQINELINNCSYEFTTLNGIYGGKFTGKNGGTIFLPAAGYKSSSVRSEGDGWYWSSEQSSEYPHVVYRWNFNSNISRVTYEGDRRFFGLSVRPVSSGNSTPSMQPLLLSPSSLELTEGENGTVDITSGNGSYTAQSSNASVATATIDNNTVIVSGISAGTAFITVTDTQSSQSATIAVTVTASSQPSYKSCPDDHHPHLIDLGLPSGTKWACCNVDTDHPENQSPTNYGGYYAWGETKTKSTYDWPNYTYCEGDKYSCINLGDNISGTEYDVAHVKWGRNWQMPDINQRDELLNYCTYEWTTEKGVRGARFTSKKNGANIFLPASGYRMDNDLNNKASKGYYWTSDQYPSFNDLAHHLFFDSRRAQWNYYSGRQLGMSVRPVAK